MSLHHRGVESRNKRPGLLCVNGSKVATRWDKRGKEDIPHQVLTVDTVTRPTRKLDPVTVTSCGPSSKHPSPPTTFPLLYQSLRCSSEKVGKSPSPETETLRAQLNPDGTDLPSREPKASRVRSKFPQLSPNTYHVPSVRNAG